MLANVDNGLDEGGERSQGCLQSLYSEQQKEYNHPS